MVNSPRARLPYLITYVQDEAPVLGRIHLTGCFLCGEEAQRTRESSEFNMAKTHFYDLNREKRKSLCDHER